MTKNFNALFKEISTLIDEDVKGDIAAREASAVMGGTTRDEEGYENLAATFKPTSDTKEVVTPQVFKEISFRINGQDVKLYGRNNIMLAAAARYGTDIKEIGAENEISTEDADEIENAYREVVQGEPDIITKVEDGSFRVFVPKETYASDDYPSTFRYGDMTLEKNRQMYHKGSNHMILIYLPANVGARAGVKAYELLVKMLSDTIVKSGYYAKVSSPEIFEATYGFEASELLPDKPLLAAGVDPSTTNVLRHIIRFTVPSKFKTIDVSVALTFLGPVDIEVLLRADEADKELSMAMEAAGEDVDDLLAKVFTGASAGKFYTVDKRKKNFSDAYISRSKAKVGYMKKQKERLAAQKNPQV